MTERTQLLEPGNQPCSTPTKHSNRAMSAQHPLLSLAVGALGTVTLPDIHSGIQEPHADDQTENGENQAGDSYPNIFPPIHQNPEVPSAQYAPVAKQFQLPW